MSVAIKITLNAGAAAVVANVRTAPAWMISGIVRAMKHENDQTVSHILKAYLSFPRQEPPVAIGCRAVSGRLRQSLRASAPVAQGNRIISAIGSNVEYAAAQEFGFEGDESVRAHTRMNRRTGVAIGVRAHTRHVNLTGRGFVQRGLSDRAGNYTSSISKEIVDGWNQNKTS